MVYSGKYRFDNRVVIVTGSGGGLGRVYALYFARKGAKVVINDIGTIKDPKTGASIRAADTVVEEIQKLGGQAAANYDSVDQGEKIVATAIKAFGRVDILINNAGILRDKSFSKMTPQDFDLVQLVHVQGTHRTTRACWPYFQEQKFGRVINVSSSAGLYGNYGQANYSAAKLDLLGMANSLADEGFKDNIIVNTIAPFAASKMTATVMPQEVLDALKPELVMPLVAYLTHESNTTVTGTVYEVGAGFVSKLRRQVSAGLTLSEPQTTEVIAEAATVLENIDKITDFEEHSFPQGPKFITDSKLQVKATSLGQMPASAAPAEAVADFKGSFDGKVALIIGANTAYGTASAVALSMLGCKVVINSAYASSKLFKNAPTGEQSSKLVVEQCLAANPNGSIVVDSNLLDNGEAIVQTAVSNFGGLHIIVNATELNVKSAFEKLSNEEWDLIQHQHLRSTFQVIKSAWPVFGKQKFGRVINVASAAGIYGLGQFSGYCSSKSGVIGFTNTIALEGQRLNITCNSIAPLSPEFCSEIGGVSPSSTTVIASLVAAIASEACDSLTGGILQVLTSPGTQKTTISQARWQRTGGYAFPVNVIHTVEDIRDKWDAIVDFDNGEATTPGSTAESFMAIHMNIENKATDEEVAEFQRKHEDNGNPADGKAQKSAASTKDEGYPTDYFPSREYSYTPKEAILYNYSIGATTKQLDLVYENHENFHLLPSFAVVPSFLYHVNEIDYGKYMGKNYNPLMVVHAEQYVEFTGLPIPSEGTLTSKGKIAEIIDKGKTGAIAILLVETYNSDNQLLFKNEFSLLARSSGGFGGKRTVPTRSVVADGTPNRKPDFTVREKVGEDWTALYRWNGDLNPLHIDPMFAQMAGFKKPIAHGLLTLGVSMKHLASVFGPKVAPAVANTPLRSVGCRFSKPVYPGETIETQVWVTNAAKGEAVFQTVVVDRKNEIAISPAKVEFFAGGAKPKM